jgi:hypothetical protein
MADSSDAEVPTHPTALIFLIAFKAAAMVYYILCGWLPFNFVLNFCVVSFLLMCDFWTVRNLVECVTVQDESCSPLCLQLASTAQPFDDDPSESVFFSIVFTG